MPDLTIENRWVCKSALYFEREVEGTGTTYTVLFTRTPQGPYAYGWRCTCKAFQYGKGKPCKHIERVKAERCGWHQEHDGGEPVDGKCPKCGGNVTTVQVGV